MSEMSALLAAVNELGDDPFEAEEANPSVEIKSNINGVRIAFNLTEREADALDALRVSLSRRAGVGVGLGELARLLVLREVNLQRNQVRT